MRTDPPRRSFFILSCVLFLSSASTLARAEDPRELLAASELRHRSKTQEYAGQLTVFAKDGRVRRKGWSSYRDGYAGDARQLIRFTDPPEVRGVGFLSIAHPGKNPDQWLYLPSMKRERRIASQDRDAAFVGTDFSYEDLDEFDHSRYELEMHGEEAIGGADCWRIVARPREKSSYASKRLWLRKDNLYVVRVDSYRKDESEPHKRLLLTDLAEVDGHLAARRLEMSDLKKGGRTVVELEQLAFDRPQPGERFTLQNLVREGGD